MDSLPSSLCQAASSAATVLSQPEVRCSIATRQPHLRGHKQCSNRCSPQDSKMLRVLRVSDLSLLLSTVRPSWFPLGLVAVALTDQVEPCV